MRKDSSVSLQQLRACLRAHERLLDEDWPEAAWSSASDSEDEEENPRQAYRRLNPQAGQPLKENNTDAALLGSDLFPKADPPRQNDKSGHHSDMRRMNTEHWASGAPPARYHHTEASSAPLQHQHNAFACAEQRAEHQNSFEAPKPAAEAVSIPFTAHGQFHNITLPTQQPLPPLPTDYPRLHSSLACVNVQSRNPSPDLISEPEIHQLDDDINSIKALLQEQEPVLQPIKTSRNRRMYNSTQPSPSMSPATSPYQKASRAVVRRRLSRRTAAETVTAAPGGARARTASPLRHMPHGVDSHMYGLTPTEHASAAVQPGRLQRGEAGRLQGKLQSAELRAVGLGETVKVLEASLKVKDDTIIRLEGIVADKHAALIHAKQRTPTKQPKPVTPSKAAPNLKHHMASRKLEKDLKKRIADLQEDLAASRAAVGSEKERSSALGESVRRAQQARREGEQERVRAASAADMVRQKVSGLAARVKALQRQLEEEQRARLDAEGEVKAVKLDLERERAQRTDATTELSRCAPRVQELQIAMADQRRAGEDTAAQLQDAKGQLQSLGSALRDTRKMYAECAHDNSLMKAALTSTQQGVKAMHSIIQQQHQTASAPTALGTSTAPLSTSATAMHHLPRTTAQHPPQTTHNSNVSATAAAAATAAATAAAATHGTTGARQPPHDDYTAAAGVDATGNVGRSIQGATEVGRSQLNTFSMDNNAASITAFRPPAQYQHFGADSHTAPGPVSAWWPTAANEAPSHMQHHQQHQHQPDSPRVGRSINTHAAGHGFFRETGWIPAPGGFADSRPSAGGAGSFDSSNHPPGALLPQPHVTQDGDEVPHTAAHDPWQGVKQGGHARSESADSDQLSFDQEVQDIIHRGALITAEPS